MNFLRNSLSKVDLYGDHFQLRFNQDAKFKNACGGILTLVAMSAFVFATIMFGYSFLLRSDFITNRDEGFYSDEEMPFLKGEDMKDSYLIFTFPKFLADNLTKEVELNEQQYELRECKEEELLGESSLNASVDLCFDMKNVNIGSELVPDGEDEEGFPKFKRVTRKLNLSFPFCKGQQTCSFTSEHTEVINMRFPFYTFSSSNYDNPMQLNWTHQTAMIRGGNVNMISVGFSSFLVDDDKGWLIEDKDKIVAFTYENTSKFSFRLPGNGSFVLELKLEAKFDHFFRRFQKIQDLSALIGGFLKIVTTLLSVYNISFQKVLIEHELMHKLFRTKFHLEINDHKKNLINPPAPNISIIDNFVKQKSGEKDRSDMDLDNKVRHKKTQKTALVKSNSAVDAPTYDAATKSNIVEYHWRSFFSCCSSRSMSRAVQKVRKGMSNIDQLRDFTYIAEKILNFDMFMHLILEEGEIDMINLAEKPVLHCETETPSNKFSLMDKVYTRMGTKRGELEKNVVNYLKDKIQAEGCLNDRMSKLLMSMSSELQERVNQELEGIKGTSK